MNFTRLSRLPKRNLLKFSVDEADQELVSTGVLDGVRHPLCKSQAFGLPHPIGIPPFLQIEPGACQVGKIRTTITIETDEIWVIRRRRFFIRSFCPTCNREVTMIPPAEAARLVCRDLKTIYSLMENDFFHLFYFNGEKPFICLNSLCSI